MDGMSRPFKSIPTERVSINDANPKAACDDQLGARKQACGNRLL
jgi:hypothetical protein